jgi:tetratricopeptide (TPR) repeat protein
MDVILESPGLVKMFNWVMMYAVQAKLKLYPALVALVFFFGCMVSFAAGVDVAALQKRWYLTRSAHFNIFTYAGASEVQNLSTRLEQYHDAYTMLAGAQSADSPPIIVMAFPDHDALKPFLPLYQGQPANLAGFFKRGADENLIVMCFNGANPSALDVIFHEYSHLLFRKHQNIWPLWLGEGMAELYSTFEASGRSVQIGKPIPHHIATLSKNAIMHLSDLMAVTHDSPDYNESERQGVFYAESWMLTHYLVNGDNPAIKARFHQYTPLLQSGESPIQAMTNALKMPIATLEELFKKYLARGDFQPVNMVVPVSLNVQHPVASRFLAPVETEFWLGNELLRIDRAEDAQIYFKRCLKTAPNSPLGYEGLGLAAANKDQHEESVRFLKQALERNSSSFVAHTAYAQQKLLAESGSSGTLRRIDNALADDLVDELTKSINMRPDYALPHQLLGIVQLSRGQNLDEAEKHFQRALELQPENQACEFYLAQVRYRRRNNAGAKELLADLAAHAKDPELRKQSAELLSGLK